MGQYITRMPVACACIGLVEWNISMGPPLKAGWHVLRFSAQLGALPKARARYPFCGQPLLARGCVRLTTAQTFSTNT